LRNDDGSTAFDIVSSPFDDDRSLYDGLAQGLGPLGLKLDYERIRMMRPRIAEMLRPSLEKLEAIEYAPLPGHGWRVSNPEDQGVDPLLVAELYLDAAEKDNLYGLLVVKNGRLIAEDYFNEGALDNTARLQSVTKSITSALVGIALEKGCLSSVDQRMLDFFPELAGMINDPRKEQITIQHLLQMRAGFPWEESRGDLLEILFSGFRTSTLVEFPLSRDPGTAFQYNNLSSHLLGVIVARVCDRDLKSYAEENIFLPIGAKAGDWTRDWDGYNNGHADLHMTARDMAKFGLLYLNHGEYEGKQIIPAEWVYESLQNYSEDAWVLEPGLDKVGRYFRGLGYGYQWWSARVDDRRFDFAWGHGGQMIVLLEDLDMIIVVTSDPFYMQHDEVAWKHEQGNFNLVGKFIRSLPKE
jgi:CubicO group peptidase (beta-lactamase class C family)